MAGISQMQMITLLALLLSHGVAECTVVKDEGGDLEAAEANGKLEIIKQIKKVNDDGSYTIGYEADDGSFKIESRDVLGNIKGTYGYIDDNGQIKRVSYSSSNTTEPAPTSTTEAPSVVQRIPAKLNKTTTRTTVNSTPATLTTTSVIQAIPRRRVVSSTLNPITTTEKYVQYNKEPVVIIKSTTTKPTTTLYETSTPVRILAQSKPLVRSTIAPQVTQKSEGQLLRPEITLKPTEGPLYKRVPAKTTLLDDETKPVSEEPEVRGNLLRRQLPQDKAFDARQHALNAQQGAGDDNVDVYSSSVTTGPPRPLFTTSRSRLVSTTAPPVIHRPNPTIRYPIYQKPNNQVSTVTPVYPQVYQKPIVSSEYPQESSTETSVTPSPVPVVQIPANAEEPQRQQFVELRHPFHRGAILVPVNALQQRRVPNQDYQQIIIPAEQQRQQEPVYLRRMPKFRPIPVHVDEHGFIREIPPQPITPTPYPLQSRPQFVTQADIIHEVDQIKPPVSTRDFQKLLEQLIMRQSRLEKISSLTHQAETYRQHPVYQERPSYQQNHVQFIPRTQTAQPQQQHPVIVRPQEDHYNQYAPVTFSPPSNYHPTKRMARLQDDEEYLPAPVREMLLLRMLQLAINPSLPLEISDNLEAATTPHTTHPRKEAVRNVEILGEEEEHKRPSRTKRYKEIELDYFD